MSRQYSTWSAATKTVVFLIALLVLAACEETKPEKATETPESWQLHLEPVAMPPKAELAIRETIYIPVYSHIYYEDKARLLGLAETVSIRNTDLTEPIILTSVRQYGTDGTMLKSYLQSPVLVKPMATADFVVPRTDVSGGTGANFIIEWAAKKKVTEPITESVMISVGSSQSISFLTRGVVIKHEEASGADAVPNLHQGPRFAR